MKKTATKANNKKAGTANGAVRTGSHKSFPIAGVGASAGGLEALEQFLGNVPQGCGMSFVVIQHLDPTRKGIMPELLQHKTSMKVYQVKDRMRVQPDSVYVIPPNKDMSILHGVLHLFDPSTPRGLRLPIDYFFRSLAEDRKEQSIGVILSGMGSDGTLGLRSIKEKEGLVVVQDPASAKFDGMPRSAIASGLADLVGPAEELPGRIISYLRHTPRIPRTISTMERSDKSSLEKITILLRAHTGNDFSLYKKNTLYRRIERRMGIHQIGKISAYVRFLQENPEELQLLFKELLIGVTSFFRDTPAWETLKEEVIPNLLAERSSGHALRAWVPGCSTGEEAYSLAMVFKEALDRLKPKKNFTLQIFATDLDHEAIDKARLGAYSENIAADVSPERLRRFFIREENIYRVHKSIREMVIFAPQNLIMDPPFTKLDILSCRNLMIYLTPEVQKKLIPLFHYSLNPGGILFLGNAETVGAFTDHFAVLDGKSRMFQKTPTTLPAKQIDFPTSFAPLAIHATKETDMITPPINLQKLADQIILERFAPAAVLVNDKGDILYISGRTGKYLEPAAGKANWNIFVMAREGLRYELASAFQKVMREKKDVVLHGVEVKTDSGAQSVDLKILLLERPESLRGMLMILFKDVDTPPETKTARRSKATQTDLAQIAELERELQQARKELQITLEEMQTSQEELKATNEELQSTNEELQSTNEELTTSKEELQSMNEELQTVNSEQTARMSELTQANNDMNNLLNSTEIATVFLDKDLHIRRFTAGADRLFKLITGDVGRPLTDIVTDLDYPNLAADTKEVLRSLITSEKDVATHNGRWFNVRIVPYRTLEDRIDGVVITCVEITMSKQLETKLRKSEAVLAATINLAPLVLLCLTTEGVVVEFNREAEQVFGRNRECVLGLNYFEMFVPENKRTEVAESMMKAITVGAVHSLETPVLLSAGDIRAIQWSVNRMVDPDGTVTGIIATGRLTQLDGDITPTK